MKGLFFFKKSISMTPRATFKFKFDFNLLFDMVPAVWGLIKNTLELWTTPHTHAILMNSVIL